MIKLHCFRTAILALCLGALLPSLRAQNTKLDAGAKMFEGMCVTCHGYQGAGGDAPSLNRPKLERAPNEAALRDVIGNGIPDRGMPRVRRFTPDELDTIVAYVQSLAQTAKAAATGDAQRGREVYARLGCDSCHIVNGKGGSLGPELTMIGELRSADYLRQAVLNPGARLPHGTLPIPARGFSEFLLVRVVTRDGKEIRGMRVDEDSFTIQLRDVGNQILSFRKADLKRIEQLPGKSLMPPFQDRVNNADLDDLVAYLSTLRGAE